MELFSPKSKKKQKPSVSIGLDIGKNYVKLVALRRDSGKICLDDFCIQYISGNILPTLKQIPEKCNLVKKRVNISLSGKSTIVRDLWIPRMNPDELRLSLGYELDQYVPFPIQDIYYDSYILDEGPLTRKEGQMRVVLAVVKKKYIDERIAWLKEAGLVPDIICVDAVSLFNIFQKVGKGGGTIGLVDIGGSKSIIDIISDNVLTFTREIEFGTTRIRESASRGLSIGMDEVEKLICSGDSKIKGWVQDLESRLSKELWSSFEYYEGQERRSIEKVYLTGGGALFPELPGLLSQSIGVPVEVWNPLDKIEINLDGEKKAKLMRTAPIFSIAAGLALRSL